MKATRCHEPYSAKPSPLSSALQPAQHDDDDDSGDDGDDGDDGDGGGEGDHLGKVQRVSLHGALSTDSCMLHRRTCP